MKRYFFTLILLLPLYLGAQDFAAYAEKTAQDWGIVGSALAVIKNDRVVMAQGFGEKLKGSGQPVDANTVFQIGSVSKSFTATLMAMMVEEGKVAWDSPVKTYLPDFRMFDPWVSEHLQVRDLFLHRTGLPGQGGTYIPNLGYDADDIYHQFAYMPPATSLRTSYAYNNMTFIIAAKIIERVSGKSWEENIQERIFTPLGMTHSSVNEAGFVATAQGNTPHETLYRNGGIVTNPMVGEEQALHWLTVIGPAGGVNSTVTDMLQWCRFHLSNGTLDGQQLLKPESMAYLHKGQLITSQNEHRTTVYAPCWFIEQNNHYRVYFHTGTTWGFTALCVFMPEQELGMIWLSNCEPPDLPRYAIMNHVLDYYTGLPTKDYSAEYLAGWLKDKGAQEKAQAQKDAQTPKVAAAAPTSYAGTFHHACLGTATIVAPSAPNQPLCIEIGPETWPTRSHPLTHVNGDTFSFRSGGAGFTITFQRDASAPEAAPVSFDLDLGENENMGLWYNVNNTPAEAAAMPIVGLSASYETSRCNVPNTYINAIQRAGGTPLLLPVTNNPEVIQQMVEHIDVLVLTGGEDVDPLQGYGEEPIPGMGGIVPIRDFFDIQLARAAVKRGIPVLGICRGEQVLNVAFGGTLYQDIPSQVKTKKPVKHNQDAPSAYGTHSIVVSKGSVLHQVMGADTLRVNSFHHQAVKDVAPGFTVTARAADGVVECIEMNPRVLGVQFHPEGLGEPFLPLFKYILSVR